MADLSQFTAQNLFDIKGWTAVVTGGGTGLGLITAKALAANGAKVYITGRRAGKLKDAELIDAASGGSIIGIQMDCTDKQSIQDGVAAIASKEKFVNLLINNVCKNQREHTCSFTERSSSALGLRHALHRCRN